MSDFKVGDLCEFVEGGPSWLPLRKEYIGHEVIIVAIPSKRSWADVDVQDAAGTRGATFFGCLRKKPPKAKPREPVGEWDLCPWQPKQVTVNGQPT